MCRRWRRLALSLPCSRLELRFESMEHAAGAARHVDLVRRTLGLLSGRRALQVTLHGLGDMAPDAWDLLAETLLPAARRHVVGWAGALGRRAGVWGAVASLHAVPGPPADWLRPVTAVPCQGCCLGPGDVYAAGAAPPRGRPAVLGAGAGRLSPKRHLHPVHAAICAQVCGGQAGPRPNGSSACHRRAGPAAPLRAARRRLPGLTGLQFKLRGLLTEVAEAEAGLPQLRSAALDIFRLEAVEPWPHGFTLADGRALPTAAAWAHLSQLGSRLRRLALSVDLSGDPDLEAGQQPLVLAQLAHLPAAIGELQLELRCKYEGPEARLPPLGRVPGLRRLTLRHMDVEWQACSQLTSLEATSPSPTQPLCCG